MYDATKGTRAASGEPSPLLDSAITASPPPSLRTLGAPTGIPSYETTHQRRGSGSAALSLHAPPLFPPPGALSLPPQLPPPPPLHNNSSSSSSSSGLQGMVGAGVGSGSSSSSGGGGGGGGPGAGPGPGAGDGGRVMVHWTQSGPSVQATPLPSDRVAGRQSGGDDDDDLSDDDDELLTPAPPRERLSYTRYQLELLNGIYISVRYPNSVQKQLIAKRVGISREQVKIWFQNRRRKDVVTSKSATTADNSKSPPSSATPQDPASPSTSSCSSPASQVPASKASNGNSQDSGRKSPDTETQSDGGQKTRMVPDAVVQGCISELKRFSDEKLKERKDKRKAKGKRRNHTAPSSAATRPTHSALQGVAAAGNPSQPIGRLFQAYDMVAPPNKVTPTAAAYLNTSSNRFNHSHNTSAFSNPRDYLANASAMPRLAWDTGLEPSPLSQSLGGGGMVADSLAHSRAFGGLGMAGLGMGLMSMGQATSGAGGAHGSLAGTPQDSLPALTDLLSYSHAANFRHQMGAACNSSRDAHGAPLPPPPSHPPSIFSSSSGATNGAGGHASLPDLGSSSSSRHNGVVPPPSPASPFGLSRVYPFPFIADPPIMLSSLHQQDPLRHHTHHAWPRPHPSPPSVAHFSPMAAMNGIDPYKPVVISSFSNPFFPHPTNPTHWPPHPGTDPAPPPGGSGFS